MRQRCRETERVFLFSLVVVVVVVGVVGVSTELLMRSVWGGGVQSSSKKALLLIVSEFARRPSRGNMKVDFACV